MTAIGILRRRRAVAVAAALATLAVLTGCSSGTDTPNSGTSSPTVDTGSLLPPAEGTTRYPLTLDSPYGETVLEERPERIAVVTAWGIEVESLALLDVTPVLINELAASSWTLDALPHEIEATYPFAADNWFPAEAIAASDPDLIIVLGDDVSDDYEKLAAIAPVLAGKNATFQDYDWREGTRLIGEALDLQAAADEAIASHDAWLDEYTARNSDFQGTSISYLVAYTEDTSGLTLQNYSGSAPERFFEELGFAASPNADQFEANNIGVSNELISQLDGDVFIVVDNNSDGVWEQVQNSPLWQSIAAVQEGRVLLIENGPYQSGYYVVDAEQYDGNLPAAISGGGPLATQWAAAQLEQFLPALITN